MSSDTENRKLVVVKPDHYSAFLEEFEDHLPGAITVHGWIRVAARFGTPEWSKAKVWTINDREKNGFFVVITDVAEGEFQSLNLYWDMEKISNEDATEILSSLPNFNWKKLFFLATVHSSILEALEKMMLSEKLSNGLSKRIIDDDNAVAMTCKQEDLKYVPLPSGYRLGKLEQNHCKYVHENWHNNIDFPEKAVDYFIESLETTAIFTEDPKSNGLPVSWTIFKMDGQIGATYTNPEYRGQKLGTIVTVEILQNLAKQNIDPWVIIADNNTISINMHEKIGFKKVGCFGWEFYCGDYEEDLPKAVEERFRMIRK